jgi:hypothetical protein
MRQFVSKLHAAGQSWVPIVDPAVTIDATFRAYVDGTKDKIWMRDHKGKTYVGQVSCRLIIELIEPSSLVLMPNQ